jgi:hypothetical protein
LNVSPHTLRFKGALQRVAGPGPFGVTLLGRIEEADGSSTPAQLSLIGREAPQLPDTLADATVEASGAAEIVLRSGTGSWRIPCRTWQLHREVGAMFYAAIPPRPTPWIRRLTWRLLLGIAATAPGQRLLSRRSRGSQATP